MPRQFMIRKSSPDKEIIKMNFPIWCSKEQSNLTYIEPDFRSEEQLKSRLKEQFNYLSKKRLLLSSNLEESATIKDFSIPFDLSTKPKIQQPEFPPTPPLSEYNPSPKPSPKSPSPPLPNPLTPTSPKRSQTCHSYSPPPTLKRTSPPGVIEFCPKIVKSDTISSVENVIDRNRTFPCNSLKPTTSELEMNFPTPFQWPNYSMAHLMPMNMSYIPLVQPKPRHAANYINSPFMGRHSPPPPGGGLLGGSQEAVKNRLVPIQSQRIAISPFSNTMKSAYHRDILKEQLKENSFNSFWDPKAEPFPPILRLDGEGTSRESNVSHYTPLVSSSTGTQSSTQAPRYFCSACNRSYATYSGLSRHKQFHCSTLEKKNFTCKHCQKLYSSLGALKMHIRTHTLPCKCHICGKAFSRPWLLQGHIRTHTGEKPFACTHCSRSFADRSNLRAHLQTHSEVKKYCCESCSKTFSRMSLLTKHNDGGCGARSSFIISPTF